MKEIRDLSVEVVVVDYILLKVELIFSKVLP